MPHRAALAIRHHKLQSKDMPWDCAGRKARSQRRPSPVGEPRGCIEEIPDTHHSWAHKNCRLVHFLEKLAKDEHVCVAEELRARRVLEGKNRYH